MLNYSSSSTEATLNVIISCRVRNIVPPHFSQLFYLTLQGSGFGDSKKDGAAPELCIHGGQSSAWCSPPPPTAPPVQAPCPVCRQSQISLQRDHLGRRSHRRTPDSSRSTGKGAKLPEIYSPCVGIHMAAMPTNDFVITSHHVHTLHHLLCHLPQHKKLPYITG